MIKPLIALFAAATFTGCLDSGDQVSEQIAALSQEAQADVVAAREATEAFHDIAAAEAAGYSNTGLPCFDGQGYHWINPSLIGTNDVTKPHILVYFPRNDHMQLVALEWITPIVDETTQPPELFGHHFHGPNNVPGVPFSFFALHVWAWLANTDGMFEDGNSKLVCP